MSLTALLRRADLWRGRIAAPRTERTALPTGHAALDSRLPGGGWPLGTLTEILYRQEGIGELTLPLPALARLSATGRWQVWVAPPHLPYAPALVARGIDLGRLLWVAATTPHEALWAMEQALRSGACGAVLAWLHPIDPRDLRRLQLAAGQGDALALVFRPAATAHQPSPAALRLHLEPEQGGLRLHILKCRGTWSGGSLRLDRDHAVA